MILCGGSKAVISLPNTKSSQRSGMPEHVTVDDPLVVRCLVLAMRGRRQEQALYTSRPAQFADDLRWIAGLFGITHANLTPYGLRRGGATWHFLKYGRLDATA
eukprot:538603-Karenia_brevis.AAC.1